MVGTQLELRFDPRTIEHLGAQMYSHLPNAIAELIANAYDADASTVTVSLSHDDQGQQFITVTDDGHGMDEDALKERYLRIGRNRRTEESPRSESGRRQVSGKKGIGKLALFGVGEIIRLKTTRKDMSVALKVQLNYSELLQTEGQYFPDYSEEAADGLKHGTQIELRDLKRKTQVDAAVLATSLSRLFNYTDEDFRIWVTAENGKRQEVTRDLRFEAFRPEYSWDVPKDLPSDLAAQARSYGICGRILSAKRTIDQKSRGITTYVNGRLANEPEFFDATSTSYAFSYLAGFVDIDILDYASIDLIASDRRAVNWEAEESEPIHGLMKQIVTWVARERRRLKEVDKEKEVEKRTGVDTRHWTLSVKGKERRPLKSVLDKITKSEEITDELQDKILDDLLDLAPVYANMHWRHLHPSIQSAAAEYYEKGFYFEAVEEAMKAFTAATKKKSKVSSDNGNNILEGSFGKNGKIDVAAPFSRAVADFSKESIENVRESQKFLSVGLNKGFRNILAHQLKKSLIDKGLFTYDDCLDALGILSYLYRRMEEGEVGAN